MTVRLQTRTLPTPINWTGVSRTDQWRSVVEQVLAQSSNASVRALPVGLVLGVIYAESRGIATEVSDDHSSYGLMQVNLALHGQGYTLAQIMDPATNVAIGASVLADAIATKGGDIPAGISRYNGGSGNRQSAGTRFCIQWKEGTPKTGRTIDNDCDIAYVTTTDGEFGNQPYVDDVLTGAAQLGFAIDAPLPDQGDGGGGPLSAGMGGGADLLIALVLMVGVPWLLSRIGPR